jgi:hypothetical protein
MANCMQINPMSSVYLGLAIKGKGSAYLETSTWATVASVGGRLRSAAPGPAPARPRARGPGRGICDAASRLRGKAPAGRRAARKRLRRSSARGRWVGSAPRLRRRRRVASERSTAERLSFSAARTASVCSASSNVSSIWSPGRLTNFNSTTPCLRRVLRARCRNDSTRDCGALSQLHPIGRNGRHKYNNQDHAMMTGLLAALNIWPHGST